MAMFESMEPVTRGGGAARWLGPLKFSRNPGTREGLVDSYPAKSELLSYWIHPGGFDSGCALLFFALPEGLLR